MKKYYYLLSILSGFLLALSFPNFIQKGIKVYTSFFIWFAFVPVFYVALKTHNKRSIFILSVIAGTVFYMTGFYWLWFVKPMGAFAYVAWFFLSVYLSLWIAIPITIARYINDKFEISYIFSIPILMTVGEYIREWLFTGFPLLTPAQSQYQFTLLINLLKITGVHGVNYLIYTVNILIAFSFLRYSILMKDIQRVFTGIILISTLMFLIPANLYHDKDAATVKTAFLQADIDQDVEWSRDYKVNTYKTFSEMVKNIEEKDVEIIVWPETGYPGVFNLEKDGAERIAAMNAGLKAFHIVGSDRVEFENGEARYFNSAYAVSPEGEVTGSYSKYHLVPFGEYVPLSDVFPFVKKVVRRYGYSGFERGKKIEPLKTGDYMAGAIICYDSLFPEISRTYVKKGAQFLVHLSYESWYGMTPCSAQVLTNTILRGVENNVDIVRCVASGISSVSDKNGRVRIISSLFEKETGISTIKVNKKAGTFYTLFGDWYIFFVIILMLAIIILEMRKRDYFNKRS